MSLDVYLTTPKMISRHSSGIFVRKHGEIEEISRYEWDELNPGHEPCIVNSFEDTQEVYSSNITHNLGAMAEEAGIYSHLWRPEEIGITKAAQLIEPLTEGLALMRADPERFEKHNPKNGWGSYKAFVPWVEKYLEACKSNPDADVRASR